MEFTGLWLLLLMTLTPIWGRPSADLVSHLPGFDSPLTFEMYSGYLQGATPNVQLHYVFVEAASGSATAPLVLWLNGGPGCSSLMGMFTENGPLFIRRGNQLVSNKYSWNKYANIVYIEAPAGVGFSFSRDGNVTTDDDLVADNNYFALTNFFEKFPEFKGRDFYIIGESYGGVYVPTLALRVVNHPEVKLKGIAVDNGLTSYTLNDNSLLYFAYYHSLIDASLWTDLVNYCCDGKLVGRCLFTLNPSPKCQDAVISAASILSFGLNMYNLYAPCDGGVPENSSSKVAKTNPTYRHLFSWRGIIERLSRRYDQWLQRMRVFSFGPVKRRRSGVISREQVDWGNLFRFLPKRNEGSLNGRMVLKCSDDSIQIEYLNMPAVRSALNIPKSVQYWSVCDDEVYTQYKRIYFDLSKQYRTLLEKGIRTHIFNGDVDMACNAIGDEWFVNDMGLPLKVPRHPWFFNATDGTRQIGGYRKSFLVEASSTTLTFSTVRGAGHMVPADKPVPAFTLFSDFLWDLN
ncbi:lysosomal protective protein [Echinococcus multilocularis]|uniref:Carboxypeptidase n=1 Tax=Echinococcus multilocularis TaxID=6211 RepID=A0A087VZN2_ECHMU|nr:lysosomal protective protein [Echinococcus multilocularis]